MWLKFISFLCWLNLCKVDRAGKKCPIIKKKNFMRIYLEYQSIANHTCFEKRPKSQCWKIKLYCFYEKRHMKWGKNPISYFVLFKFKPQRSHKKCWNKFNQLSFYKKNSVESKLNWLTVSKTKSEKKKGIRPNH